jgi:hypothetical protein
MDTEEKFGELAAPELRTLTPEVVLQPKPRHTPGKKLRGMGEIFLRGHIF